MATFTPKRLSQGQLTASDATQYTATAVSVIIKELVVCNTSGASVNLWVSFCASGATVGDSNRVLNNVPIAAGATVTFAFAQVLAASGFISAKAGAATSLTLTVSGVEFV